MKSLLLCASAIVLALPLSAQVVGHQPSTSPYLDLEYAQELTLMAGYIRARHDPAGVAPQSQPMLGARYEISLTGPLFLSVDGLVGSGHRNVIDPLKPAATRALGTQSNSTVAADFAIGTNLTGMRSWHNLVPQLRAGLGFVRNAAKDDSSGFAFGTRFAFSYGGGVKYVKGRFQVRGDVTDRLFKLGYPDTYYRIASDNSAVLPTSTISTFYTHHTALTLGLSYLFGR